MEFSDYLQWDRIAPFFAPFMQAIKDTELQRCKRDSEAGDRDDTSNFQSETRPKPS